MPRPTARPSTDTSRPSTDTSRPGLRTRSEPAKQALAQTRGWPFATGSQNHLDETSAPWPRPPRAAAVKPLPPGDRPAQHEAAEQDQ